MSGKWKFPFRLAVRSIMGLEADAPPVAILKATDIRRTIEWYTAAGFELRGLNPPDLPTWCELARDGLAVQFLSGATPWEGKPAFTGCLYLYPASVDSVYEEIRDHVNCESGVEERDWGARELVLRDPDGYWITFTQPAT